MKSHKEVKINFSLLAKRCVGKIFIFRFKPFNVISTVVIAVMFLLVLVSYVINLNNNLIHCGCEYHERYDGNMKFNEEVN